MTERKQEEERNLSSDRLKAKELFKFRNTESFLTKCTQCSSSENCKCIFRLKVIEKARKIWDDSRNEKSTYEDSLELLYKYNLTRKEFLVVEALHRLKKNK